MKEIGSYEARTKFSQILRAVSSGEKFLHSKHPARRHAFAGYVTIYVIILNDRDDQYFCHDFKKVRSNRRNG